MPGGNEYIFAPRGTNNPAGARIQHADWHREEARRLREEIYQDLIQAASELILQARDGVDRSILDYYYCRLIQDDAIGDMIGYSRQNVNKHRLGAIEDLEMRYG